MEKNFKVKLHWPPEKLREIVENIREHLIRENQDHPEANLGDLIDFYEDIISILKIMGPTLTQFKFPIILDPNQKKS